MTSTIEKTSDYLSLEELKRINKYFLKERNYVMTLLIELGFRTLLRYSDLARFKWQDILHEEQIVLNEKKTNKRRHIKVGNILKDLISQHYELTGMPELNKAVFHYSLRHTNRLLKLGARSVGIRKKQVSTHSLRKSGSRFIWEENHKSDESLLKLSMILNHSSTAITRRYLGITREEISDIYSGFDFVL